MIKKLLCILLLLCCTSCSNDYSEYCILDITDNKVTLAPSNYDGDTKDLFKDQIIIKELAEKVTYKEMLVRTTITEQKKTSKTTTTKISLEDIKTAVEYDCAYVRITFNKEDKINSITLWGEIAIYE